MTVFLIGAIVFGMIVLALIGRYSEKISSYRVYQKRFQKKWLELLNLVKTPEGMSLAVINADKLLDEALRRRHFKGGSMGERLVSAQHNLSDNDRVWYAHKLRNRLVHETDARIKKKDAVRALEGIRQGLKDLGAL